MQYCLSDISPKHCLGTNFPGKYSASKQAGLPDGWHDCLNAGKMAGKPSWHQNIMIGSVHVGLLA
jgi:hypothetical protein